MKKIGLLASICMFTLLIGGCAKNVESTLVEDSSEIVSDIPAAQNDVPDPAEEDAELINMGIHEDEHVIDVPNYYSSVSDADESGVYLGGAGSIYRVDSESEAEKQDIVKSGLENEKSIVILRRSFLNGGIYLEN